jgi:hypothetical protein
MGLAMVGTAAILGLAMIPFWSATVTYRAVHASNVAILILTIALSIGYDRSILWAHSLPREPSGIVASLLAARMVAAGLVALIATATQSLCLGRIGPQPWGAEGTWIAALACVWVVVVLLPWATLLRVTLGRRGGPWAVLALALVATWIPAAGDGMLPVLRWLFPVLPPPAVSEILRDAGPWAYALLHAACVGTACVTVFARGRVAR